NSPIEFGKDEGSLSHDSSLHVISSTARCRVAIVGFGTVGSAVARRLTSHDRPRGLELAHVYDRRAAEKCGRLQSAAGLHWTSSIDDVLQSDVDVAVETIGRLDPAAAWIRQALAFGLRLDPARIQTQSASGVAAVDFEHARRRGGTIRQLAHAQYDDEQSILTAWVAPVIVRRDSIFARTTGAQNAAIITGVYA